MPRAPSDTLDKFMLRLPAGIRDRIAELAKASGRSMNAEIVLRLQQSLDGQISDAEAKAAALEAQAAAARASFRAAEANLRSLEGQLGEAMERVRAWNAEQARMYKEAHANDGDRPATTRTRRNANLPE